MGVEALGHGRGRPLAHYGPHLNPSEGCCVLQDAMGAEGCVSPLPQLSWRTRQDSWDLKSALSMNFIGSPSRLRFCGLY